ncbi:MAG: DUF692 domain-containing protein [Planctomycetales bacterium]|nr:DUF692 domain-containing protein [bacterium]UNM07435.1 MAG: DUF692 domain-containing protein [Planctomycetales bacterium]
MIGIGWRRNLAGMISIGDDRIQCLEIVPDHFLDSGRQQLAELSGRYPVFVHGLSCSLGTPGPMDEEYLRGFKQVCDACQPHWISEHVAFTRAGGIDLGHLNPLSPTRANLQTIASNAQELQERLERPLLLENITSSIRLQGDMPENEFLVELCRRADCRLLLDVTNLFINARNHGFDPQRWLELVPAELVVQLHVVGYQLDGNGRYHDSHDQPLQADLLELIGLVMESHQPEAVILERDDSQARPAEIIAELEALHAAA